MSMKMITSTAWVVLLSAGLAHGVTVTFELFATDDPSADTVTVLAGDPVAYTVTVTVTSDDPEAGRVVNEIEALRDPSHVNSCTPAEWEEMISLSGLDIEWREVRENRMPIEPWFKRMRTPVEVVDLVRPMILESTGALRDYFQPVEEDSECSFRLMQIAVVSRKSVVGQFDPSAT